MEQIKNRKIQNRWNNRYLRRLGVVFAVLLLLLGAAALIPDRQGAYSAVEKRQLAKLPVLTAASVADGSFAEGLETYLSDHFFLRNQWVELRSVTELCLFQKRESNGVYLGSGARLFQRVEEPDTAGLEQTVSAVCDFAEAHGELDSYMLLVPTAATVYSGELPACAWNVDEAQYYAQLSEAMGAHLQMISVWDMLLEEAAREDAPLLYYRTDHHWTTYAAYLASQPLREEMGIKEAAPDYEPLCVSNAFCGSLIAKSGFLSLQTTDAVHIYVPKQETAYVVYYVEEQEKTATLYSQDGLLSDDAYTVFFGGNYPLIQITTEQHNGRRLLVFKDSYANCLIPFLLADYEEIDMIDARYYSGAIEEQLQSGQYTQLLYVYSMNGFLEDNSLSLVLNAD